MVPGPWRAAMPPGIPFAQAGASHSAAAAAGDDNIDIVAAFTYIYNTTMRKALVVASCGAPRLAVPMLKESELVGYISRP